MENIEDIEVASFINKNDDNQIDVKLTHEEYGSFNCCVDINTEFRKVSGCDVYRTLELSTPENNDFIESFIEKTKTTKTFDEVEAMLINDLVELHKDKLKRNVKKYDISEFLKKYDLSLIGLRALHDQYRENSAKYEGMLGDFVLLMDDHLFEFEEIESIFNEITVENVLNK